MEVEKVIRDYRPLIYATGLKCLGLDQDDADDLFSMTALKIYQNITSLRNKYNGSLSAWIRKITYNCGLNLIKQHQRHIHSRNFDDRALPDLRIDIERDLELKKQREEFEKMIAGLPDQEQRLIRYTMMNLTQKSIGILLNMSQPSVSRRLKRVIDHYRQTEGRSGSWKEKQKQSQTQEN